jgi:hypothetical protein
VSSSSWPKLCGKLVIPTRRKFPLSKAADVHADAEKRRIENVLLLV